MEYHRRCLPWFYVRAMIYSEPSLTVECKCDRDGPGDLSSLSRFHCHIRGYSQTHNGGAVFTFFGDPWVILFQVLFATLF